MREINAPTFEANGEGFQEVSTFSIKANAKAFRILIDGLYSDKPRAIVREIASNALDSHIMAGCPEKPFDCHLPNRLEPYFAIRDYGVSLSHDMVMRLYTTVFESTKEDSNTQVGRFGLGSKTPFAYTEAYTVTAYLNGEARMYNAFIDGNGVPSIALMMKEATDEPNGIEVSFPVSTNDCNSFVEAARFTFLGFDVRPNITGANIEYPEPTMSGATWVTYGRDTFYRSGLMVKQGCVVYPVDIAPIMSAMPADNDREMLRRFSEMTLVVTMPIGTVDITPSRESLSYDTTTVKNIVEAFTGIFEEVIAPFVKEMDCKTPWEAYKEGVNLCKKIENTFGYDLGRTIQRRIRWHGEILPITRRVDFDRYPQDGVAATADTPARPGRPPNPRFPSIYVYSPQRSRYAKKHGGLSRDYLINRLSMSNFDESMAVYVIQKDELDKIDRVQARINFYFDPETRPANYCDNTYFLVYGNKLDLAKFYVSIGRPPLNKFRNMADMPLPPKKVRATPQKNPDVAVRALSRGGNYTMMNVPVAMGGYYFVTDRETIDRTEHTSVASRFNTASISNLYWVLADHGILPASKLYSVGKSQYAKIAKNPKWINIFSVVEAEDHKLVTPGDLVEIRAKQSIRSSYRDKTQGLADGFIKNDLLDFEGGKPMYNLLRGIIESDVFSTPSPDERRKESIAEASKMFDDIVISPDVANDTKKHVAKLVGEVREAYPMLRYLMDTYGVFHNAMTAKWIDVANYVKMVDSQPKA